jgi:hypothetical protein
MIVYTKVAGHKKEKKPMNNMSFGHLEGLFSLCKKRMTWAHGSFKFELANQGLRNKLSN